MATDLNPERFGEGVMRALQEECAKIVEEEAEEAAKRVRDRIKGKTAQIAAKMFDHYSVERMGRDLVIRVQHEGGARA